MLSRDVTMLSSSELLAVTSCDFYTPLYYLSLEYQGKTTSLFEDLQHLFSYKHHGNMQQLYKIFPFIDSIGSPFQRACFHFLNLYMQRHLFQHLSKKLFSLVQLLVSAILELVILSALVPALRPLPSFVVTQRV